MARGHKTGGRSRGTANKATIEALERERIAEQARKEANKAYAANVKLGKDTLEEFMIIFATQAKFYQPVLPGQPKPKDRRPNETKFLTYAGLTVKTAKDLADFQSPKFKAIQVVAPQPNPHGNEPRQIEGKVVSIDDPVALQRTYQRMIKQVG